MASQEIEAINSSSCIIEVGYGMTMREEDVPDVGDALIFRVSRSLPDSDRLYTPRFVSIGPFHYGKEELKWMEKSKSEAVRRMQIRIQKDHPQASIKSFVEGELLFKDKEIRNFYGEHISFPPIELAWMVIRDACFIFEFFLNYIGWGADTRYFYVNEERGFSWKYDEVFDVNFQNPMMDGVMKDILLFENQIPLWVLKGILRIQAGSAEAGDQKLKELANLVLRCLTRHEIFMWTITPYHNLCFHVLEILYRSLIGNDARGYENQVALQIQPSRNSIQIFFEKIVCGRWRKLCLRFRSPDTIPGTVSSPHNYMQIWFKIGVDSMKTICERWCKMCLGVLYSNKKPRVSVKMDFVKLPTALELIHAGVKIYPVTDDEAPEGSAIRWVRFDDKTSTLYLPEMVITTHLYSVMSNIIAMELATAGRYYPRPMTQYVLFMDELMDSEEDVAVLRNAGVIHNFLGSNQQVADLFNSLGIGMIPYPRCRVINDVRRGLYKYTGRKYKILWSEFITAYFSKPWLVCGSVAAVLLLWMTMAQVLCLFINCNPKSS